MKWFADDYYNDGNGRRKKSAMGPSNHYELLPIRKSLGWIPSLDLYETEQYLIMLLEMAGMQLDNVEINVDREEVQLRGNRWRPPEDEMTRIHRMEIEFGPCEHIVALPQPVDPKRATLIYRDGFVFIRLPKEVKIARSNQ
jgi:HSP20 family protein